MIERLTSAERLNEIANDPSVYPWVCGLIDGPLDLTAVIANADNIALFGEHGGVLFEFQREGHYEAHTQVLPSGRGAWAVEMVNAALSWMFTRTDAVEIFTRVPNGNLAARALVRAIHGEYQLTNRTGWFKDRQSIPADWFSLSAERWINTSPSLIARGIWFHERLEEEYARLGKIEEIHEEDETHNRIVGAAVEMIMGGQIQKAARYYNRWATMSGYEPINVLSTKPVIIDIRDAILLASGDEFKVIKCR